MTKRTGVQTSGIEVSPERARRMAQKRRREEKRWAKKSGAVTVRWVCPECGGPHHIASCDQGAAT